MSPPTLVLTPSIPSSDTGLTIRRGRPPPAFRARLRVRSARPTVLLGDASVWHFFIPLFRGQVSRAARAAGRRRALLRRRCDNARRAQSRLLACDWRVRPRVSGHQSGRSGREFGYIVTKLVSRHEMSIFFFSTPIMYAHCYTFPDYRARMQPPIASRRPFWR